MMELSHKADTVVRQITKVLVLVAGGLLVAFVVLDLTDESGLLTVGLFGSFAAFIGIAFDWSGYWDADDKRHRILRLAGEGFLLGSLLVLLSLVFGFAYRSGAIGVPALAGGLRILHVMTLALALIYGIRGWYRMLSIRSDSGQSDDSA